MRELVEVPKVGPRDIRRKLTAVLSADVAGYSRLMGDDEEATLRALLACRALISDVIDLWDGRVVSTPGDAVLAEFNSVVDAMHCTAEMQEELAQKNAGLPAGRRLEFRIGIHLGDVLVEGDDIYGDGVNVAVRLQGLAEPGGTCVSGTVYDSVKNKLDFGYEDLGAQSFKNIAESVRAYRIRPPLPGVAVLGSVPAGLPEMVPGTRGAPIIARPRVPTGQATESRAAMVGQRPELPSRPSIAVLPFDNMSGDPEQEYFVDGVTEDLITALSSISGIFVIARNSAFSYKGKAVTARNIGAELGVRYLLEGSVRKADQRVRITAQLIDASTEGHLWAERYDRDLKDIFSLQDEVTNRIASELEVRLTEGEFLHMGRFQPKDMKAYDYVLRGRGKLMRFTKSDNAEAQDLFQKAIELDRDYAMAHTWLARAHASRRYQGWSADPKASTAEALKHAREAVRLEDALGFAHGTLAMVHLWKGMYERAIAEAERAVELDPNDAEGHNLLAAILTSSGRPGQAAKSIRTAIELNPNYPVYYLFTLGACCFGQEEYDQAIDVLERGCILDPGFLPTCVLLAASYGKAKRAPDAGKEWKKGLAIKGDVPEDFVWVQELLFYRNEEDQRRLAEGLEVAQKQIADGEA